MQLHTMEVSSQMLIFTSLLALTTSASRPNIVLIVADDLGWNDVGFHGSEIKTPYIDSLASSGVILNNYYVSPICTPTRGALMTGRYPIHLGLQHNVIAAAQPYGLPLNHTTMAQHLKRLGFATHIVGKWHLGMFKSEYLPTNRGFDSHFGYWNGKEDYYTHEDEDDGYKGLDFRNNTSVWNVTRGYSTELYTKEFQRIIDQHDPSKPLFLYMAFQAVHAGNGDAPLQAPQKYIDRFPYISNVRRRTFAGMVSAMDDSVGQLARALRKKGLMDNTIIAFTTDNGGPANNYDKNAACNYPLRGIKNTLWEGGVHGVGFVHSKLIEKHHKVNNNLFHVSDWLPTLYSAAGGDVTDLSKIDGMDMWNMIKSDESPVRNEVLHNIDSIYNFSALRVGKYKLVQGDISNHGNDGWYPCTPPHEKTEAFSIPTINEYETSKYDDWHSGDKWGRLEFPFENPNKYHREFELTPESRRVINIKCNASPNTTVECKPGKAPCLFDIEVDPCEYDNLAAKMPDVVNMLQRRLKEYEATMVQPVNRPVDPKANPKLHGGVWGPWKDNYS